MTNTPHIARTRPMNLGSHFRATTLRDATIDPFLGVDHAWVSASPFAPHPHAGFSAVSYLFLDSETGIANRDSRGTTNTIAPGGLHWTAAGRGIVHEEVPVETGKTVHMLQIFVNLPEPEQAAAPFALSLEPEDVPVVQLPGVRVRVPVGEFAGARSPLAPPTAVTLLDIRLDAKAELRVPVPAGQSVFVLPVHGLIAINGRHFHGAEPELPVYAAQAQAHELRLAAEDGPAQAVVFAGAPLHQPVFWQGPMALASAEALQDRIAAYQRGEFGQL